MAVHVIASSLMTSDLTPHRARSVGHENWVVSFLPGRTLTCAQAVAALKVAEVVPGLLDSVGELAEEVGLTAREAVGMAIHQAPWVDERQRRHAGVIRHDRSVSERGAVGLFDAEAEFMSDELVGAGAELIGAGAELIGAGAEVA